MSRQKKKKSERGDHAASDSHSAPSNEARQEAETGTADQPEAEVSLDELRRQLQEATDKQMRVRAELENFRKRMQREAGEVREYAKASTIEEFLTVFDHFQMAMDHMDQTPDASTIKQGMEMILGEFRKTFVNLGVEQINAQGRPFDPGEHEAVAEESSESVPAGIVLRQWKCGYRLGSRLLRPATVVVSSGPPESGEETEGSEYLAD